MDISFKARSFDKYESLVFNLDVQYDYESRTVVLDGQIFTADSEKTPSEALSAFLSNVLSA